MTADPTPTPEQDEAVRLRIIEVLHRYECDDEPPGHDWREHLPYDEPEYHPNRIDALVDLFLATPPPVPAAATHDPSDHDCRGGVRGDKYPLGVVPAAPPALDRERLAEAVRREVSNGRDEPLTAAQARFVTDCILAEYARLSPDQEDGDAPK